MGFALLRLRPQKVLVENRLQSLQQKIAEMEKSNNDLARLLDYFKSDAYLEKEAKLKLNVRRPDEQVVFVQLDNSQPASVSEEVKKSWWKELLQWWNKIF